MQDTLDSLIYSMTYVIDDCPIDNPGLMINVGYDNGEGLGIQGDGLVTFDEIEYTIGECPGNLGRVFNESTEEHDWGPQRTVIMNGVLYFIFDAKPFSVAGLPETNVFGLVSFLTLLRAPTNVPSLILTPGNIIDLVAITTKSSNTTLINCVDL